MQGRWLAGVRAQRIGLCAVLALLAGPFPSPATAEPVIRWRVENPFRLFTDPDDTEVHRATYKALRSEERLTPVLSAERALQSRHDPDGWAASMFRKTCWDWNANQYVCDAYADYMNPSSHRVIAEIANLDEAGDVACTWLTAPKGGREMRGKAVSQLCSEPLALEVPYPGSVGIKVEIGGREVAASEVKVRDILVVGMGDSFASGEGNPDVPVRFSRERAADYGKTDDNEDLTGYPARIGDWRRIGDQAFIEQNARWQDQACHRSLYSHQYRAALQLAVEDPHRAVTYVGLSCSGAEVTYGLFLRYKGNEWVPNPPVYSQISAAAEAQCGRRQTEATDLPEAYHLSGRIPELKGGLVLRKCPKEAARKIDLILLSIGGNDVGFSRLVANAVLADQSYLRKLGGWIGEVHGATEAQAQIVRLEARYKSLKRALHNLLYVPWNESDRIILTGYPGMALTGDGSETCKDGRAGLEVVSDFRLSEQKMREGAWIGDKLHRLMRESAYTYGWTFAETHRRQFIDRGICSGVVGDGTSIADELRLPRKSGDKWFPYNPADYRAYTPRRRWFRTPNDAFMTGNFHVAASLVEKVLKLGSLEWFQLLLASTYSGAFHPTAEGHAAIADAVADKARVVLSKYGQSSDREQEVYEAPPPPPANEGWTPDPNSEALPKGGVSPPDAGPAPVQSGTPTAPSPGGTGTASDVPGGAPMTADEAATREVPQPDAAAGTTAPQPGSDQSPTADGARVSSDPPRADEGPALNVPQEDAGRSGSQPASDPGTGEPKAP